MHRVELKVQKDKLNELRFLLFLMHRVELKGIITHIDAVHGGRS